MTAIPLDFYDIPIGPANGKRYLKVSAFCAGRHGINDIRNEDQVVVEPTPHGTLLAVVDGITPRTAALMEAREFGTYDKVSTGWLGARIVANHIRALKPGMSLTDLVKLIYEDWLTVRSQPDFPDREIIGAVFALMVPWEGKHGAIWSFGDCLWGYRTESPTGPWKDSLQGGSQKTSSDAARRKDAIDAEMRQRGLSLNDVQRSRDLRGEMARLGSKVLADHRHAQQGSSWLNSWERVQTYIHPVEELPEDVRVLSLATDGSVIVPRAMDLGLSSLKFLRNEDPLMVGNNGYNLALAKGFVGPEGDIYPYPDDVGIVVALC